jgi:hypothetical protein
VYSRLASESFRRDLNELQVRQPRAVIRSAVEDLSGEWTARAEPPDVRRTQLLPTPLPEGISVLAVS